MEQLRALATPSTLQPSVVVPFDFSGLTGGKKGFRISWVWMSIDGISGLAPTTTAVLDLVVAKSPSAVGLSALPALVSGMIIRKRFPIGVPLGALDFFIDLPEPVLVDEDSLFCGATLSDMTGTARCSFVLVGEAVDPSELDRAVLIFQATA